MGLFYYRFFYVLHRLHSFTIVGLSVVVSSMMCVVSGGSLGMHLYAVVAALRLFFHYLLSWSLLSSSVMLANQTQQLMINESIQQ